MNFSHSEGPECVGPLFFMPSQRAIGANCHLKHPIFAGFFSGNYRYFPENQSQQQTKEENRSFRVIREPEPLSPRCAIAPLSERWNMTRRPNSPGMKKPRRSGAISKEQNLSNTFGGFANAMRQIEQGIAQDRFFRFIEIIRFSVVHAVHLMIEPWTGFSEILLRYFCPGNIQQNVGHLLLYRRAVLVYNNFHNILFLPSAAGGRGFCLISF